MHLYDVTIPLSAALPVWPGDPPVQLEHLAQVAAGDAFTLSRLSLSVHAGTHVDAPAHFIAGGATVDALPLAALVGEAVVADVSGRRDIAAAHLPATAKVGGARLMLKTGWAARLRQTGASAMDDFPALTLDAADWLVERGVRLVGIESPSVERFTDAGSGDVHRRLLGAGIVIVEGLDLSAVRAGTYMLACLPLRLAQAEGAPARAVLWQAD